MSAVKCSKDQGKMHCLQILKTIYIKFIELVHYKSTANRK